KIPTNLCNPSSSLILASIGNIALLSGSCASQNITSGSFCTPDQYIGGNITTNGTANIQGNIIAGNKLDTGGDTSLKGSILAASLGRNNGSTLNATTNIDFAGQTDENTTITLPGEQKESEGETVTPRVKIKWARYI